MKTHSASAIKRGFTLMELMVAMAITSIIVTVLVSITSIALDTWNRSRSELRASRQAKSMIDSMARDFESLVTRSGNKNQWLSAVANDSGTPIGSTNLKSTNASELIFFTAVTDRYNGQIGDATADKGGDVSCVAYQLSYRDPVGPVGSKFETFVLNRQLLNPDETFNNLLGKEDLVTAFSGYKASVADSKNFVCENVFQFSVTFHVQVTKTVSSVPTVSNVPVTIGRTNSTQTTKTFKILGTGIESEITGGTVTADELRGGRITSMEMSVTVISDLGIDQLRTRSFADEKAKAAFLAKNSYQYTKLVQLSTM
jgi:prepilin-type N-terminal cleavage/methylation domain-containing protein